MPGANASPVSYLIRGRAICPILCQEDAVTGQKVVTPAELVREGESARELRFEYGHRTDASPTRTRRQLAGPWFRHFWGGHRLARLCLEGPSHAFGVARDHGEIGARRLVGLGAALLPIAQGAERDAIARGEFFLRQPAPAATFWLAECVLS